MEFFASKAQLIAIGEITTAPAGRYGEWGVSTYYFEFKPTTLLKANVPDAKSLRIVAYRFEVDQKTDTLPYLKFGQKCILFLTKVEGTAKGTDHWKTVEPWFGVQPYNSRMEEALKEIVAAADKKKPK